MTPYALDNVKKSAFDEKMKGLGQSEISIIAFHNQPQKAVAEEKF